MLRIKVLACAPLFLTLDEVLRIIRHRFIIVLICLVSAPPMAFLIFTGNWLSAVFMILFPIMTIVILTTVIRWQARKFSRDGVTSIQLSLHFGALSLLAGALQNLTTRGLTLPTQSELPALVLWALWSFAVAEAATWFFVTFMLPFVLADLRKTGAQPFDTSEARVGQPARVGASLPENPPSPVMADPLPDGSDDPQFVPPAGDELPQIVPQFIPAGTRRVTIARESIVFSELLYLRIERNYLDVVTTRRKMLLRSTLSEVVDQLSLEEGALVHRSYWVARHAVTSALQREGELFLELLNREIIKVARPRKKFVLDWLKEANVPGSSDTAELRHSA